MPRARARGSRRSRALSTRARRPPNAHSVTSPPPPPLAYAITARLLIGGRPAALDAADANPHRVTHLLNCDEPWCTRLHFRTASFCTERSGHYDAFDQGISFFLPNMSWIEPPGYVHQMVSETWGSRGRGDVVKG